MHRADGSDPATSEAQPSLEAVADAGQPPELLPTGTTDPPAFKPIIRVVGTPPDPARERESAAVALRALPVHGVNRRRAGWLIGIVVSAWIVAVFARQVGEASAAAAHADQVRADNAALAAEVSGLLHERDVVQDRSFIEFQARAFGLGNAKDHRFTLTANAPKLPPNAPGSASVRLQPQATPASPLDSWLALLFGPSR